MIGIAGRKAVKKASRSVPNIKRKQKNGHENTIHWAAPNAQRRLQSKILLNLTSCQHQQGVEEVAFRNIQAVKELTEKTRTSYGPNGNTLIHT